MFRSTPTAFLAALCVAALSLAPDSAGAAKAPEPLRLAPGARVGVVNLLDPEVTHFHASHQIENSFLKTYTVRWQVSAMLFQAVREGLTQLGLTAVAVAPSDELRRARESCFLDASLAKGLPKTCAALFAQFAAAEQLSALIMLGPGRNNADHAGRTRHRELPEYLRGWCFVTGEDGPASPPVLLNLSELLLVGVSPRDAQLADREWGGNGVSWSGYQAPPDLKAFPEQQLEQLQPLFDAMLRRQVNAALARVQVAR